LTERLKRENKPKSTRSAGKLFQIYNTFSKKDLTELLQKCLKILHGWPLVVAGCVSRNQRSMGCFRNSAPVSSIPEERSTKPDRPLLSSIAQHRTSTEPSTKDSPTHEASTEVRVSNVIPIVHRAFSAATSIYIVGLNHHHHLLIRRSSKHRQHLLGLYSVEYHGKLAIMALFCLEQNIPNL